MCAHISTTHERASATSAACVARPGGGGGGGGGGDAFSRVRTATPAHSSLGLDAVAPPPPSPPTGFFSSAISAPPKEPPDNAPRAKIKGAPDLHNFSRPPELETLSTVFRLPLAGWIVGYTMREKRDAFEIALSPKGNTIALYETRGNERYELLVVDTARDNISFGEYTIWDGSESRTGPVRNPTLSMQLSDSGAYKGPLASFIDTATGLSNSWKDARASDLWDKWAAKARYFQGRRDGDTSRTGKGPAERALLVASTDMRQGSVSADLAPSEALLAGAQGEWPASMQTSPSQDHHDSVLRPDSEAEIVLDGTSDAHDSGMPQRQKRRAPIELQGVRPKRQRAERSVSQGSTSSSDAETATASITRRASSRLLNKGMVRVQNGNG